MRASSSLVILCAALVLIGQVEANWGGGELITANLNNFYTSHVLNYSPGDFKAITFNGTAFEKAVILGNAVFVIGGIYMLSLLPETAFCQLKGTCRGGGYGYGYGQYANYYRRQEPFYNEIENPEYFDYSESKRKARVHRRRHRPRRVFRRDVDEPLNDLTPLEALPAEHRQVQERPSFMRSVSQFIFGDPIRRISNGWSNLYQHYEDYWRFRLANGSKANFGKYKAQLRHRQRHRNQQQAHQYQHHSRQDDGPVVEYVDTEDSSSTK